MKTPQILTLLSATLLLPSAALAQYATDFEAPTYTAGSSIDGQDSWTSTVPDRARVLTAAQISTELTAMNIAPGTTVHSGSQALLFAGTGGSGPAVRIIAGLEAETEVQMNVWVRPLLTSLNNTGNVFVVMEDAGGDRAAGFRFGAAQSIDFFGPGQAWVATGKKWNASTWYRMGLRANYATKSYEFFIDGVPATNSPISFANANADNFAQVRLYRGTSQAGAIWDDLSVAAAGPRREIFWSETGSWDGPELGAIYSAAYDGTGMALVATNLNRPIGIAVDPKNGYLYWAEDGFDPKPSRIVRANLDGTGQTNLFTKDKDGFTNAQMIGLDPEHGYIYWTDFYKGVCRGKIDGTGYQLLGGSGNETNRYTALALDLERGHIYFSEPLGPGILWRMDLDGKNLVVIDNQIGSAGDDWAINSMVLDTDNRWIYFPHAMPGADNIIRMNLNSSEKTVLVSDTGREPIGIAFGPNDTLYWVNGSGASVGTSKRDGTGNINQLIPGVNGTAFGVAAAYVSPKRELFWSETGPWDGPQLGAIYSAAYDGTDKALLATNLNRPIGIALDSKNKYIYWAEDGYDTTANISRIVRANWGGSGQTNLFTKDKDGFTNAQMIGLDLANGHIYWTDFYKGVCRGNIDGTGYTELGGSGNETNRYTALGLDLVNRHIYFAEPQGNGILWRMDMDGKNRVVIDPAIGSGDWAVNAITVDGKNGYVYFTHAISGADTITRMKLNGSEKTVLVSDAGREPLGITIGPDGKMYWICATGQTLGTANIDGSWPNKLLAAPLATATGFGIAAYVPEVVAPLSISNIKVQGTTATITWQGGQAPYQLQRRASLGQGAWENVGTAVSTTQATDTVTGTAMYYRVQAQ